MTDYLDIFCLEPTNFYEDMDKSRNAWVRKMFQIMPCLPDNIIAVIPPRRERESEESWLGRCVMIRNITP